MFTGVSFFPESEGTSSCRLIKGYPTDFYHRNQCHACPLRIQSGFKPTTPDMPPYGTDQPSIYMLGEAPGAEEDAHGRPFIGRAGRLLHDAIDPQWESELRWSNVVRTRPKGNETPDDAAIESCRPSVIADIEATQPHAIFGFGGTALYWAIARRGIAQWIGRRIPLQVGTHACWYFPIYHPSFVSRAQSEAERDPSKRKQAEEVKFLFDLHLRTAFAAVEAGLPAPVPHTRDMALDDIVELDDLDAIDAALLELSQDDVVGIDLETTGTRPYQADARILSVGLSGAAATYAFAIDHPRAHWTEDQRAAIVDMLHDWLVNAQCLKVQFTGFEMEWLAHWLGADVLWSGWADAQGQAYLLDARQGTLSLEFLCLQHFGLDIKALHPVDRKKLADTSLDLVLPYNGCDARYHRQLYLAQSQLISDQELDDVWDHHNRRVAAAVATQLNGIPVNLDTTKALHRDYTARQAEAMQAIQALPEIKLYNANADAPFRPSATKDVLAVLQGLGYRDLTNVEADVLERIDHPVAKSILQWRGAAKVLSTYILPLLPGSDTCAVMADGMLHPSLLVNRVRTWRSSSEDPNSQNFPKHGAGKEARSQVQAPPGHVLVAFDYGQIQARNVAQESDDKALVTSFWDRHDIHADWRERIFELYPRWGAGIKRVSGDPKLLKEYRQQAKGFVFASFFGAGGKKVAEHLGVPVDIGYRLHEEFRDAFPGIARWHQYLHAFYAEHGYVTGLTGFRRYAPVAHTEIINTPIQSDEAMIVFDAMIRLAETQEPHFAPNMEIHDDLTFVWPKQKLDEYAEYVIGEMLNCSLEWAHKVPVVVEMSVGHTWDKMEPVGEYESDRWEDGRVYKQVKYGSAV